MAQGISAWCDILKYEIYEFNEIYPDRKIAHYSYCRNISRKPYRFTDGRSFFFTNSIGFHPKTKSQAPTNYVEDRGTTVPCLPSYVIMITVFVRLPITSAKG